MFELGGVSEISVLGDCPKLDEKDQVSRYYHFNPEDLMIPPKMEDLEAYALELYKKSGSKFKTTVIGSQITTVPIQSINKSSQPIGKPIQPIQPIGKSIPLLSPPTNLISPISPLPDRKCPIIMKSGPRVGQPCSKPWARNNTICSYHIKQTSKL